MAFSLLVVVPLMAQSVVALVALVLAQATLGLEVLSEEDVHHD